MKLYLYFIFICLIIHSVYSHAWNALGHMVIANIAYERLQPEVRSKVEKMVFDLANEYPELTHFYDIAPWPDTLRTQKIETFTHWHYINIPFSGDNTPVKDSMDTDNIVWAIQKIEPIVKNSKANPYEKARFLAFLVHFIGDIHQPLHTVGRITANYPDGDRGGNLYLIKYPTKTKTIPLHKLWDQGMEVFNKEPTARHVHLLTEQITSRYPESYFGNKTNNLNPVTWANEGLELSMHFVYTTPEYEVPNANYLAEGTQWVEQSAALAGYRLANVLNQLLGNKLRAQ